MKVAGFTFVRNAVKYEYPFIEAIQSILPICDELIVAVGNCEDDTRKKIEEINSSKIKIIDTIWDDSLREGGRVLAEETNKALDAVSADVDWCFYIQADEVFHENDLPKIKEAMLANLQNKKVEGLVFKHINFFATYDYEADSHKWLKNEVRVIRNDKQIRSWKDAMSFRKNAQKLKCKFVDASIYHYGWVKHPETQKSKRKDFDKLWHNDEWIDEKHDEAPEFDYSNIDSLSLFKGSHPAIMHSRIKQMNWQFDFKKIKMKPEKIKHKLAKWLENITGLELWRFKNYDLI
jgi:hypothetical protein